MSKSTSNLFETLKPHNVGTVPRIHKMLALGLLATLACSTGLELVRVERSKNVALHNITATDAAFHHLDVRRQLGNIATRNSINWDKKVRI